MIEGTWLVLRAAGLVLSLQAAGAALFGSLFSRQLERSTAAVRASGRQAALAALAVLFAQVLFEPIELGGDAAALFDGSVLRLFLSSSNAAALLTRFAGVACLVASFGSGQTISSRATGLRRRGRLPYLLAMTGCVLTVGSFLLTGHTAAQAQRLPLAALLLVHAAIVAFWFGSLQPLRQVITLESRSIASNVLSAFSAVAVWLVPLIALAGAAIAALLLPDVEALLRPYGLLMLTKVALFAALMGLAALNRLRLAPALAAGTGLAPASLRRSIALEYVLICVVLAVTAVMSGSFSPAQSRGALPGPPAVRGSA